MPIIAVVTSELTNDSTRPEVRPSFTHALVVTKRPLCGSDASTDIADDATLYA